MHALHPRRVLGPAALITTITINLTAAIAINRTVKACRELRAERYAVRTQLDEVRDEQHAKTIAELTKLQRVVNKIFLEFVKARDFQVRWARVTHSGGPTTAGPHKPPDLHPVP